MDVGQWESNLLTLLDDLGDAQESLLALLNEKRRHLAERDWTALSATHEQEVSLLQRLEACHRRRQQLLEQARQLVPQARTLRQAARWMPLGEDLQARMEGARARMTLLQHESLSHWVVAQRSLLHLAQILEVLASGGRLKPTYGRETLPVHQGALVDEQI